MKILEIKRHLNKPDESYPCDLLLRGQDYVVLKYVSDRPGRVGGVIIEAGSTTHAYYRAGQGYIVWKIGGPDGQLKGYLFHICKDLQVDEKRVEYLDMLLDLWIDPDGQLTVLDQDEVEACATKGVIGKEDLAWITSQELEITGNLSPIIADFERLLRTLGG